MEVFRYITADFVNNGTKVKLLTITSRQTHANEWMSLAKVLRNSFNPHDLGSSSSGAIQRVEPPRLVGASGPSAKTARPKSARRAWPWSSRRMFPLERHSGSDNSSTDSVFLYPAEITMDDILRVEVLQSDSDFIYLRQLVSKECKNLYTSLYEPGPGQTNDTVRPCYSQATPRSSRATPCTEIRGRSPSPPRKREERSRGRDSSISVLLCEISKRL